MLILCYSKIKIEIEKCYELGRVIIYITLYNIFISFLRQFSFCAHFTATPPYKNINEIFILINYFSIYFFFETPTVFPLLPVEQVCCPLTLNPK